MQLSLTKLNEERILRNIQNVLEANPNTLSVEGRTLQSVALILHKNLSRLPTPADDVDEFHDKFGLGYDGPPRELDADLLQFRDARLDAELAEYHQASTLEERLDALVDLVYVAIGTARAHGWDFNEAWRRVHAANMKKARVERQELSDFGSKYDVVKPPGWQAPILADLVEVPEPTEKAA